MAADMHLHAFAEGEFTEEDLHIFFAHTLGSKHFDLGFKFTRAQEENVFEKVTALPSVWIGEVSWLKAMLTGDQAEYVPELVQLIADLVGEELPVIDRKFCAKVKQAFRAAAPSGNYDTARYREVAKFLRVNQGKRVFCVSW